MLRNRIDLYERQVRAQSSYTKLLFKFWGEEGRALNNCKVILT